MTREFSHNLKHPMESKNDAVTVVRADGKEFVINRSVLAEHINRGFTVKNAQDQPSQEELSNAVGYRGDGYKAEPAAPDMSEPDKGTDGKDQSAEDTSHMPDAAADNLPVPDDDEDGSDTVPEEKAARKTAPKEQAAKKA